MIDFDERYLVVVSGPSGCGKDTVVKELLRRKSDASLAVSCTTRSKRDYEIDGKDYYFINREQFEKRIADNRMLEYTEYNGNMYGTPLDELENKLADRNTVVLVIEVNGARNVKERYPNSLLVFIVPPSIEELERRLFNRNTETKEEIERRLAIAEEELKHLASYDEVIQNDTVEHCAGMLADIIEEWQKD